MNNLKKYLAKQIYYRRQLEGLSQEEFANKIGVSVPLISQIERGIANPTLSTLEKIASYFKISVAEILDQNNIHDDLSDIRIKLISKILIFEKSDLDKIANIISKL